MSFKNKFLSRMFTQVHNMAWDLTTGQIGIRAQDGIYTLLEEKTDDTKKPIRYRTSVNPFDTFAKAIPAFASHTKIEDIRVGEVILGADQSLLGFCVGKTEGGSLVILGINGMTKHYTPPKVNIMNIEGAMVVRNLFNAAGGTEQGFMGMQGAGIALLAMSEEFGGEGDGGIFGNIMPWIMFSQQQTGGKTDIGQMLPTLLMIEGLKGGNGGSGGLMKTMLMTQMLSGGGTGGLLGGGMNPMMMMALLGDDDSGLGGLFGEKKKGPPTLQPLRK